MLSRLTPQAEMSYDGLAVPHTAAVSSVAGFLSRYSQARVTSFGFAVRRRSPNVTST